MWVVPGSTATRPRDLLEHGDGVGQRHEVGVAHQRRLGTLIDRICCRSTPQGWTMHEVFSAIASKPSGSGATRRPSRMA